MSGSGKSIKKPLLIAAFVVLLLVFLVSAAVVTFETVRNVKEDRAFDDLKKMLGGSQGTAASAKEEEIGDGAQSSGEEAGNDEDAAEPEAEAAAEEVYDTRERYGALYEENSDLFGWVTIEGTKIDYPVMHTPDDPEYYLHRAFDKKYSYSGVPFLDADCYEGCGNYILYGHHMKNGSMFAALMKYMDKAFWEEHPTVIFDTLDEHGVYDIIAVFSSKVYHTTDTGVFRWYNYTDLTDETAFNEYIEGISRARIYDTGKTAEYGDTLLTLSTCGKDSTNRFVVVAKKVNQ